MTDFSPISTAMSAQKHTAQAGRAGSVCDAHLVVFMEMVMQEGGGHFHIEKNAVGMDGQDVIRIVCAAGLGDRRGMIFFIECRELSGSAAPSGKIPSAADAYTCVNIDGTWNQFHDVDVRIAGERLRGREVRCWNKQHDITQPPYRKKSFENLR